ncbi:MAG: helix-turn-helix transcriptional regulator [Dactylosporangium sp.]|nr:helix-turn-helix transcriptional regulator [Dactylosporangium sp.]NNJ61223.1 helix-turn-helix transcriptional regulator [Dactylosporangium sp.]
MTGRNGPTLRAQWLGQQIKELRESAGITLRHAADYLERDPSTVSRFESAEYPIRRPDLMALLDFYRVSDPQRRAGIMTLREEVWKKGWWDDYADTVDCRFIDYVWLESRAKEIHSFDSMLIPGLLQTPAYAGAAIRAAQPDRADGQVERGVELRIARQRILAKDAPCQLRVVLDESVLRRRLVDVGTWREQLSHLVTCAERPNVEIRLLPFDSGLHSNPTGIFKIFVMENPYPVVAYTETLAGRIYVEEPVTERFTGTYNRLQSMARSPRESTELILATVRELA